MFFKVIRFYLVCFTKQGAVHVDFKFGSVVKGYQMLPLDQFENPTLIWKGHNILPVMFNTLFHFLKMFLGLD